VPTREMMNSYIEGYYIAAQTSASSIANKSNGALKPANDFSL